MIPGRVTLENCPGQQASFEQRLISANLPPPGPAYYAARRQLWLTPPSSLQSNNRPFAPIKRLEKLLCHPNVIYDNDVWNKRIGNIWSSLSVGEKLKCRMPLNLAPIKIKIIHAAWVRNDTWPIGMEAPDSDQPPEILTTDAHRSI